MRRRTPPEGERHADLASRSPFAVRPQDADRRQYARPRRPHRGRRSPTPTIPNDPLRGENPLGKIPALILEDGEVLFDSAVIAEYLDWLAGGDKIIPAEPADRFRALTLQALADGIMDAALLQVYEALFRDPALHVAKWLDHQSAKVARGLAALDAAPPAQEARDIGAVALACALGYLDLRFSGAWRADHPRLAAWLDGFAAAVPAFEATRFRG